MMRPPKKGAVMHRPPSDHFRRPILCPRCSGQPMIALPDFYLDLMFGELPDQEQVTEGETDFEQLVA